MVSAELDVLCMVYFDICCLIGILVVCCIVAANVIVIVDCLVRLSVVGVL